MDLQLILKREEGGKHNTKGKLTITDCSNVIFECDTLELKWYDNERNKSCIPALEYQLKPYYNERNRTIGVKKDLISGGATFITLKVLDVPNRSGILIHRGNFASGLARSDSRGCILVGNGYGDINKDGVIDILNSGKALQDLIDILIPYYEAGNEIKLKITY